MGELSKLSSWITDRLWSVVGGRGIAAFVKHHRDFILRTYHDLISRGISPDEALLATFRLTLRHALGVRPGAR